MRERERDGEKKTKKELALLFWTGQTGQSLLLTSHCVCADKRAPNSSDQNQSGKRGMREKETAQSGGRTERVALQEVRERKCERER